jgi:hypothetical protein
VTSSIIGNYGVLHVHDIRPTGPQKEPGPNPSLLRRVEETHVGHPECCAVMSKTHYPLGQKQPRCSFHNMYRGWREHWRTVPFVSHILTAESPFRPERPELVPEFLAFGELEGLLG